MMLFKIESVIRMTMTTNSSTRSPEEVIAYYVYAYKNVYGREPKMRYLGNQWFRVDGEMVHYRTMVEQIDQLRALAKRKNLNTSSKGMVRRLIDKLRLL
jgi:hypothetical protein